MEHNEVKKSNVICENTGNPNITTTLWVEERLRDIQKDIDDIISQAVEYKRQGNHILLSCYLAGGIMRLNRNIETILETVEMVKAVNNQAG